MTVAETSREAGPTPDVPAHEATPGRSRRVLAGGAVVATQLTAFVLSMGVLIAILQAIGYDAGDILDALWDGSVGSQVSLATSFNEAMPVVLTAVGIWLAFQAGLYNIGADGQLQMGGFVTLLVALYLPTSFPSAAIIALSLVAGMGAGAIWAGVAGALKAYRGANEIISTIMLNYVAFIGIFELVKGPFQSPDNPYTPQTDTIPAEAEITGLVGEIQWGILVALGVGLATLVAVQRTTIGLRLRVIGLNREAAQRAGVPVRRYWIVSFLASGALCGLAGGLVMLAARHSIAEGWASPWGFIGMIIAFLALRNAYMIPVWALLFGMLGSAGPAIKGYASVPDSMVTVMQTLPIIVVFLLYALARWLRRWPVLPRGAVDEALASRGSAA